MNQLLITKQGGAVVSALHHDKDGILQFHVIANTDRQIQIGDIYLGQVQNIVKNIQAAFVEIAPGINGYLPLADTANAIYANPKNTDKICSGDKLLVQVSREPIKSKPVTLTTDFSLSGKFVVLMPYQSDVRISTKITEKAERARLQSIAGNVLKDTGFGCILRTNAAGHTEDEIEEALTRLVDQYQALCNRGIHSVRHAKLYSGIPVYLADLRDCAEGELEKIRTDDATLYQEMKDFLQENQPEDLGKLQFYQDESLSMTALYRIRTALDRALDERVWLKSGAYLVIQPTEALTVIDVNSGKAVKSKQSLEENIRTINREAAEEIACQLRLRNISGMILIDFISMKSREHQEELLLYLQELLHRDPIKTVAVDITALGLIEVTRKRTSRPLLEYKQLLNH